MHFVGPSPWGVVASAEGMAFRGYPGSVPPPARGGDAVDTRGWLMGGVAKPRFLSSGADGLYGFGYGCWHGGWPAMENECIGVRSWEEDEPLGPGVRSVGACGPDLMPLGVERPGDGGVAMEALEPLLLLDARFLPSR